MFELYVFESYSFDFKLIKLKTFCTLQFYFYILNYILILNTELV